jgi:hypothetical protein
LIGTLEREARRVLQKPAPGQPPTLPSYQQSLAEGLRFAAARVRELGAETQDLPEVSEGLGALADELDNLGRQGMQAMMRDWDMGQILWASLRDKLNGGVEELDRLFGSSGKPAGYRTAAAIIRAFLDER